MVVEWVDGLVKDNFYVLYYICYKVVVLVLIIFCWVFVMNVIDLVFVDFFF